MGSSAAIAQPLSSQTWRPISPPISPRPPRPEPVRRCPVLLLPGAQALAPRSLWPRPSLARTAPPPAPPTHWLTAPPTRWLTAQPIFCPPFYPLAWPIRCCLAWTPTTATYRCRLPPTACHLASNIISSVTGGCFRPWITSQPGGMTSWAALEVIPTFSCPILLKSCRK